MPSVATFVNEILTEDMYGGAYNSRIDQRVQQLNAAQLQGMYFHMTNAAKSARTELWKNANEEILSQLQHMLKVRTDAVAIERKKREELRLKEIHKIRAKVVKKAEAIKVRKIIEDHAKRNALAQVKEEVAQKRAAEKMENVAKIYLGERQQRKYLRYAAGFFIISLIVVCSATQVLYIVLPMVVVIVGITGFIVYRAYKQTVVVPYVITDDEIDMQVKLREEKLKNEAMDALRAKEDKFKEVQSKEKLERRAYRANKKKLAKEAADREMAILEEQRAHDIAMANELWENQKKAISNSAQEVEMDNDSHRLLHHVMITRLSCIDILKDSSGYFPAFLQTVFRFWKPVGVYVRIHNGQSVFNTQPQIFDISNREVQWDLSIQISSNDDREDDMCCDVHGDLFQKLSILLYRMENYPVICPDRDCLIGKTEFPRESLFTNSNMTLESSGAKNISNFVFTCNMSLSTNRHASADVQLAAMEAGQQQPSTKPSCGHITLFGHVCEGLLTSIDAEEEEEEETKDHDNNNINNNNNNNNNLGTENIDQSYLSTDCSLPTISHCLVIGKLIAEINLVNLVRIAKTLQQDLCLSLFAVCSYSFDNAWRLTSSIVEIHLTEASNDSTALCTLSFSETANHQHEFLSNQLISIILFAQQPVMLGVEEATAIGKFEISIDELMSNNLTNNEICVAGLLLTNNFDVLGSLQLFISRPSGQDVVVYDM